MPTEGLSVLFLVFYFSPSDFIIRKEIQSTESLFIATFSPRIVNFGQMSIFIREYPESRKGNLCVWHTTSLSPLLMSILGKYMDHILKVYRLHQGGALVAF